MLSTSGWLKITATNGLDILYLCCLELPVKTMCIILSECDFLVVQDAQSSSAVPALIDMNIIGRCRQLVHAEFDTTLGGELQSDWRDAFQQKCQSTWEPICCTGSWKRDSAHTKLLELGNSPLPGGLIVVPSLVYTVKPLFPVQVVLSWVLSVLLNPQVQLRFERWSSRESGRDNCNHRRETDIGKSFNRLSWQVTVRWYCWATGGA